MSPSAHCFRLVRSTAAACGAIVLACALAGPVAAGNAVYRWIDENGVTHLSSVRPPAGIPFERLDVGKSGGPTRSKSATARSATATQGSVRLAAVSPEQAARRTAAILELQNRECVVALESMDRLAHSGRPVDPGEFRRLQQTADLNCSRDPATRREQEDQAARLRVAKGDTCVQARNTLAEMLEPGRKPSRDQLKSQQQFIEAHCRAPVR